MAAGALLLGGRMMQIVGKEITSICPLCAVLVQVISASIVFVASRFGMPVSLAEIVTCAVIGFSCASGGVRGTSQESSCASHASAVACGPYYGRGNCLRSVSS